MKETPANDDCLFESLSWELNECLGLNITATQLRDFVCNHVVENIVIFHKFFASNDSNSNIDDFEKEVDNLRLSGVWKIQLLHLVMHTICLKYDTTIVIIVNSIDEASIFVVSPEDKDKTDHALFVA